MKAGYVSRVTFWALVALLALTASLAAPASGWGAGELTQKAGTAGCVTFDGSEGCATAAQVGRIAVLSPDGKHLYTAAWEPRASIQIFDRDPATGSVTPKPAPDGCWQNAGLGGCKTLGILKPSGIAISPGGENLYLSDFDGGELITFDIDGATGLLTKKTGVEGCIAWNGNGVDCASSPAQTLAFHPLVSPDGKNLYGLSQQGGGSIVTYDRDPATGVLTVPDPADGACISNDGSESPGWSATTCVDGRGLHVPEAVGISPDGANVYVNSRERAVTVFDRDPVTGLLTQKAGVAGCWVGPSAAQADCQQGEGIDGAGGRFGLDLSPDGKNVYVATGDSLAIFNRDTGSGVLSQSSEDFAACISALGDPCFPSASGMDAPQDAAVSPDGLQVYVATASGSLNSGVAVFDRDPATGMLTQKLGTDGCHTASSSSGSCTLARALPASTVLATPDGKSVYASNGGGAMAIFDRDSSIVDPDPDPDPGSGGPGPGPGQPTGGIGTQSATPAAPGPVAGGRARVGVQIVGRPQAGHYPYTASLLLTNYGRQAAVNATARIDGFHTGAPVTLLGGGASATVLDDGASRSLLVTVERIPARSSKVVLARFTPVGPGHSFYDLHASLMRNTSPGGVPKLTETRSTVTRTVSSRSGANESGTVSVTNTAGTATIPYRLAQTASAPARAETRFDQGGDGLRVIVTAPHYATASKPPTGSRTKLQGGVRLELSIDGPGLRVLGVDNPVWPMAAGIKLHYDELIDCMQRHGMLTAADQKRLKAMYTHPVLALIHTGRLLQSSSVPPAPDADAWAEQTIAVAASAVQAWEAEIVESARLDSAGGEKQRHIFLECSREERESDGGGGGGMDEGGGTAWKDGGNTLRVEVITPDDPNAKFGPRGAGKPRYIQPNRSMPYTIMFENKPTASAPAREVVITDRLDGSKLELSTFALGPVWFGEEVIAPPPGLRAWSGSVDLRPSKPAIVTVDAKLDDNGLATWHFKTIDPATQTFPEDPLAGFLPANNPPPIGEGAVTFTVAQKRNLKTGTKVANGARIVFDKNEAIETPTFTNTIDRSKPRVALRKARVLASRARRSGRACRIALAWKGADKGSGVGGYTVWVATRKKGEFRAVKRSYKRTRLIYRAKRGTRYRFRVVAADRAGNVGKGSKVLRASCSRR